MSAGGVTRSTEVHNAGEIWCANLWECRAGLYEIYGYGANQLILQLMVDGLKLQPANPTFAQARDAIMQADLPNNGGVNQLILWRAFAKRGLGFSFSTPGSTSTATPTLGTDVPPYAENADAGELPGTARTVLGSGSLTQITGTLSLNNADMYRISICDFANFSASTVGGASFNTQLFLFDANGMPVEFDDDTLANTQSTITNQFVTANGDYYLAISAADRDPVSSTGAIWLDTPFTTQRGPDGPGAANAISGWTGTGDPGATPAYTITLTGACAAAAGHVGLNPLPLTSFGSPAPSTVNAPGSGNVVFQVFVVAGTLPASTGFNVSLDASAIGLGTVALLDNGVSPDGAAGDRIFTAQRTTGALAIGTYNLPYTTTDAQGRTFNETMRFTVVNPIGVCCLSGGVCTTQSALGCFGALGQFKGAGVACDIRPCLGRTEAEPNGTIATATDANANFAPYAGNLFHMGVSGGISSTTDADYFNIGAMQVGDVLTLSESGTASGAGNCTDPFVQLYRAGSATAVAFDDDSGPGTDSLIWRFPITIADTYIVRGSSFAPANTGTYKLGIYLENSGVPPITGGTLTDEVEPNETVATANDASASWRAVRYINTTTGSITTASNGTVDTDIYSYHFTGGDLVSIRIVSDSGLDARSALLNAAGTSLILDNGASNGPGQDSPIFAYVIPSTGTYYVQVTGGTTTGSYYAVVYLSSTTPPALPCAPDFNLSGGVSVQDVFDFLAAWFAGDPRADFNNSGTVTVQDIFDFLAAWFAGC